MLDAWSICRTGLATVIVGATSLVGPTASAQTAQDVNRAAAALQLCMSPAGAAIAQCAQVKQQLGASPADSNSAAATTAVLNALAGKSAGAPGVAGLLGSIAGQAAQASAPPVGSGDYYNQATAATYNAAAAYQACVAANPNNWQSCLSHLNGGAPAATMATGLNLTGAALAGYQRCLQTNPADKCAKAYGASAGAAASANLGNSAAAAQAAQQLAPTIKALGSLLGAR